VHPRVEHARKPVSWEVPGAPKFGDDSVPARPDNVARPLVSVMPGVHQPEAGNHRVVWWDPAVLKLGVRPSIGLSQTKILEADGGARAIEALAHWEMWRGARGLFIERGEKPTRTVRTATEWAGAMPEVEGARNVEVVDVGWKGRRPHGMRFGTLVHALLATVGLDDDRAGVAAHAQVQARMLGATDVEREAAAEVVTGALQHPLLRRAAAAAREGQCRRESAIVVRLETGTLLEAIADLAFVEDGAWVVVDFKTDAGVGAKTEAQYRRQVALYVRGVADATGAAAKGYLLGV